MIKRGFLTVRVGHERLEYQLDACPIKTQVVVTNNISSSGQNTMGNLKNALIALLVPLPSIAFYLTFLHHFATSGAALQVIWTWCFNHPILLSILLYLINVDIVFWVISIMQGSHWMIDLYWTVLPVLLVNYYAAHPHSQFNALRSMVVICLTLAWSIRLSHSYFRRERWQWGAREDWRFTSMRKQYGKEWWWVSFFAAYVAQQILVTGVCLPMYAVHSVDKQLNMWDAVAAIICVTGIVVAYFADTQIHEFKLKNKALKEAGKASVPVLEEGLWQYSRHPNHFGEQLWWWGLAMFGWNVGCGWTLIGALTNSLCLSYVSALVEKRMMKLEHRANAYRQYQKTTSRSIPWFKLYTEGGKDKQI